jgi:rare lipoprotein A
MKKIVLYLLFLVSTIAAAQKSSELIDKNSKTDTLQLHKKNAHASYYHDKFNGRKTASGVRFDNNKLTAAHKKFPFGTKLKITNEKNNKSVIVEVTDRGPFIKGREIDLTKKAFMDIASNKQSGLEYVTIEILTN